VQVADAPKLDLDLFTWSRHFRNMPGQGDLDVLNFAKALFCMRCDRSSAAT